MPSIANFMRPALTGLLSVMLLCSCERHTPPATEKETFVAMGTLVEVTLYNVPREQQAVIMPAIRKDLDYFDHALHAWHQGSLGRVNQLMSAGGEFSGNPSVILLLTKAQELSAQSNGLFNPAIGQLIKAWGYHSDEPPQGPPPDDATIKQLLALKPSMQDFTIKGVRINNTNPAIQFDLGAIGKGYAVEQLAIKLKSLGVQHMLIGAAGDIKAIGQHGERPWQIGIRHPRAAGVIASTTLHDGEAISTSGDYERFYEYIGKRYHHIIDPRTGYPADKSISVTVIHGDAVVADAAATALFIAGPSEWPTIAKQMGVTQVMLIDLQGKVYLSRAMQARLKFEVEPPPIIEIVELP